MKIEQYEYREALRDFLKTQQFCFHLTFTFCRDIRLAAATDKLQYWSCRTMRRMWGREFYRRDPTSTLFYVAFPEYGSDSNNFHFHALARVEESRRDAFLEVGPKQWSRVVPSGTLFVQHIGDTEDDLAAVIGYDTKALSESKEFIVSTQFAPAGVVSGNKYSDNR